MWSLALSFSVALMHRFCVHVLRVHSQTHKRTGQGIVISDRRVRLGVCWDGNMWNSTGDYEAGSPTSLSAVCQNSTKSSKDIRVTERSLTAWTCLQAYSSPAAISTLNLTCDSYTRKAAVNLVFRGPGINWRFWGGFARSSVSNLKVLSFFCVVLNVKLSVFCQKTQL